MESKQNRSTQGCSKFTVRKHDKFRWKWSQHLNECKSQNGTGPGVWRSKRPLLASRIRCNVVWKPPKFGYKVKIGSKVQFGNNFANWCNVWSIGGVFIKKIVMAHKTHVISRKSFMMKCKDSRCYMCLKLHVKFKLSTLF